MTDVLPHNERLVTVFGGSGFIGRTVVQELVKRGWRVRVACRRPDLAFFLNSLGRVGQIAPVQANLRFPDSVAAAMRGADAVVNLVGVLAESGRQSFEAVHGFGAASVGKAAAAAGIRNVVHVSAIGADEKSSAAYARTKARGEAAIREAVPETVIFRPSVVFGAEDSFLNRFAAMARIMPVLPLVGADTKFQPVFVGDIATAIADSLDGKTRTGTTYELGGPDALAFRDLVAYICGQIGRKRLLAPVPFGPGRVMAFCTELLSTLSLGLYPDMLTTTRDQVEMLRADNLVSEAARAEGRTLEGLGITPESLRVVAPTYLWRYRATGQYDSRKLA
ncbi:MAG: complex I NDUFA9 subunit family protein [Rhodoblastus sp.]